MSHARQTDEAAVRRLAEASAWRVRLTEEEAQTTPGFEAWLAADPANPAAWAQVDAPWRAVGEAATSPELMAARRDALDRARRRSSRRWRGPDAAIRIAAGFGAVAAAVALFAFVSGGMNLGQTYRTDRGERRVVTLEDGSRISLDSSSEVKVRYTRDARRLDLLSGQARFDVAHNVQRPFSVQARDQTVVATGTAFNIDLLGPRVLVTLIQGHVTVLQARPRRAFAAAPSSPSVAPPPVVVLSPGQQLVASLSAPPKVQAVNLDRATAWEQGQLVFDNETLAAVAERVSRYTSHPVTADPGAAPLRISGVFNAGDVSTFVEVVTRYLPVQASEAADGDIVLRRRG